ncbi:IS66 family insertion sequence element accessory protein TnpA [Sporosarcina sp. FSL K6-3457]|uniref:IS66 family insertion sequence element accessory protein TnpA n=1 Tax=Sporosarcina sp. FSL K6-3457 TaxID=2978204 RepID=UPI0030FA586A
MTRDERRAMWQKRIDAFKASGESSVKTWCAENNISYQSMYAWLKKDWLKKDTKSPAPQWVSFDELIQEGKSSHSLTLTIGTISIQIEEGFNPALLGGVLQVLQKHVK